MRLFYEGGPRNGTFGEYSKKPQGPRIQSCYDEAVAKGMFGIYRQQARQHEGATVMLWQELPKVERK